METACLKIKPKIRIHQNEGYANKKREREIQLLKKQIPFPCDLGLRNPHKRWVPITQFINHSHDLGSDSCFTWKKINKKKKKVETEEDISWQPLKEASH